VRLPQHSDDDFQLQLDVTATENPPSDEELMEDNNESTQTAYLQVNVNAVADEAIISFAAAGGDGEGESVVYATDGAGNDNSNLMIIDPATGEPIEIVGPTGYGIVGLAMDPTTGILYGTTGRNYDDDPKLIQIDPVTGAGTVIGTLDVDGETAASLAFSSDGTLYGWIEPSSDDLATINLTTGEATILGDSGLDTWGASLAFAPDGTLYFFGESGQIHVLDPVDGSVIDTISLSEDLEPGGSIEILPDGTMIAVVIEDGRSLYEINPETGEVTFLNDFPNDKMSALTVGNVAGGVWMTDGDEHGVMVGNTVTFAEDDTLNIPGSDNEHDSNSTRNHGDADHEEPLRIPVAFEAQLQDVDGSESVTAIIIALNGADPGVKFVYKDGEDWLEMSHGQTIELDGVVFNVSISGQTLFRHRRRRLRGGRRPRPDQRHHGR
jgi:hypothetical protein